MGDQRGEKVWSHSTAAQVTEASAETRSKVGGAQGWGCRQLKGNPRTPALQSVSPSLDWADSSLLPPFPLHGLQGASRPVAAPECLAAS